MNKDTLKSYIAFSNYLYALEQNRFNYSEEQRTIIEDVVRVFKESGMDEIMN